MIRDLCENAQPHKAVSLVPSQAALHSKKRVGLAKRPARDDLRRSPNASTAMAMAEAHR